MAEIKSGDRADIKKDENAEEVKRKAAAANAGAARANQEKNKAKQQEAQK